jgi:hypothetical protein
VALTTQSRRVDIYCSDSGRQVAALLPSTILPMHGRPSLGMVAPFQLRAAALKREEFANRKNDNNLPRNSLTPTPFFRRR